MVSYAVIMAGGTGTRLWPLSRRRKPKQTHTLTGKRTMFQISVDRLKPLFISEQILVATGREHVEELTRQVNEIPTENYILEPSGKGTAPCIGLAAVHIRRRSPQAVMVVVTADHHIENVERFRKILQTAIKTAEKGHLVTLGIPPTYPSTGYGYVEQEEKLDYPADFQIYRVRRFLEKPDREKAVKMMESGNYSWNSGMFIWRTDKILEEFKRQIPELYERLMKISDKIGKPDYEDTLKQVWPAIQKETIDYGVMEGAKDVVVIPSQIGWSDIGSWSSLAKLLRSDINHNVSIGNNICINTHGSFIFGGKRLIATIGLEDMVIVDTDDALLICPKTDDQRVRDIVKKLEEKGCEELY